MNRHSVVPLLGALTCALVPIGPATARDRTLQPMPAQTWLQNYRTYQERAAAVSRSGEAHYQLGRWAWEHGLEDEAWEQWIRALAVDPDHGPTRQATGFVKRPDGWARPGKINRRWLERVKADGRAISFDVAIQDDVEAEYFVELEWRLKRLSWFLWQISEGQLYLEKIEVADKTRQGRFVVPAGQLDVPVMQGGGAACYNAGQPGWYVVSGGRCYVRILAHEMMHGIFGLPDERHGCYCLMQGGLYGIKTPELELCDDDSHRADDQAPHSCWSIIRRRFPLMRHPNPVDYGRAPDVEIVITDR